MFESRYLFGYDFNSYDAFTEVDEGFFSGFGGFFSGGPPLFNFLFTIIPLIIVGTILFVIIKGLTTYFRNNAAERLTEQARILTKRTNVSGGSGDSSAFTTYYITFEFEDGHRSEFQVKADEYGLLVEGDEGRLTYQGTRYLGFERMKNPLRS
ncbi:DUF2500 domain-containing protein [Paenibacillus sp. Marseille-Q4541]|uniref:DUF2500 domain-containing protein n=1 Tax=Paenibacillus sp. Marseille-Q4541 TaxID=2831522 RepID=UPI001BAA4180|nr:DUF2500 domain-containing protein [Paenibacillus sp. Marseille-Q4541]